MQDKRQPTEEYYRESVLLSDHIEKFVSEGLLIVIDPYYPEHEHTFDGNQLDRAKYNVRLGKAYFKAGKYRQLSDDDPLLMIEPHELVFVESYEVFKMPDNVVAVYDLRVSTCFDGIGLQTGLQIDPTYHGRMFCPLFNFSDKEVVLKYKDHFASVQFIYTTPPTDKTKNYGGKNRLLSLSQVLPSIPRQSGLEKVWTGFEELKSGVTRDVTRVHTRVDTMLGAVFEGMAFMIGALAVVVASVSFVITRDVFIPPIPVGISIGVVFLIAGVGLYLMISAIKKITEDKEPSQKTKNK